MPRHARQRAFRCDPRATVVTIPASVSSLDSSSFQGANLVQTITFQSGSELKTVAASTFEGCTSLKSICFPASLERLPSHVFVHAPLGEPHGISPVETITFESGSRLREILGASFYGCHSLQSICIPASVQRLVNFGLINSRQMKIEIERGHPLYRVIGDFVMDLSGRQTIQYFGNNSQIEVPDTVEGLGGCTFSYCDVVSEVLFGSNSSVCAIATRAFAQSGLQSICIPSLVTRIAELCFDQCQSLRSISFTSDSQLTVIRAYAFRESGVESISIPSTVEDLQRGCFEDCRSLVRVIFAIDAKLVQIDELVFHRCSSLGPICLPSSVEHVGFDCFSGCRAMSFLRFSVRSSLKSLRDLPRCLCAPADIPDAVEILEVAHTFRESPECALRFGRESKLAAIGTEAKGSFLQFSSRTLKLFRSDSEFSPFLNRDWLV
jgi:hypothetical protein